LFGPRGISSSSSNHGLYKVDVGGHGFGAHPIKDGRNRLAADVPLLNRQLPAVTPTAIPTCALPSGANRSHLSVVLGAQPGCSRLSVSKASD
jgi:hypothetical protein